MILGVGVDLCLIERVRRSVARFGKDWLDEVFTDEEQARLGVGDEQAHRAAIGFALKEACAKALGTGFARGTRPQNFLVAIAGDHCSVRLTSAAKRFVTGLCPPGTLPVLRTHWRSSETSVSAYAVLAAESDAGDSFSISWISLGRAAVGSNPAPADLSPEGLGSLTRTTREI